MGVAPAWLRIVRWVHADRLRRAITQASSGLAKKGFLLRPIKRTSAELAYGIVKEARDEASERLDHEHEATVSWSAEPDPAVVQGDHPIALNVAAAYDELRGKVVADDWSAAITSFLLAHDAARIRAGVFWIPPQRLEEVSRFGAFIGEVGIDLVLCEIDAEARHVVESVAHSSLEEQLLQLQAEADAFDGTQKPSTYARRLDQYQHLRQRAVLYRDALGVGVDSAEGVLAELEQKVGTMLELRQQTTIHRSAQPDHSPAPVAPPTDSVRLRFAQAIFRLAQDDAGTLIFVSGDEGAKASILTLESMGLADRWQPAGAAMIKICNSGPAGQEVSIAIKPPANTALSACTNALDPSRVLWKMKMA